MGNPFIPDYSQATSDINQASQRFSPYYKAGVGALKGSMVADTAMMLHPTGLENRIMRGYNMSPYAQYQTNVLNTSMSNQAAAAGELGTPNEQIALAQQEQGIVSKDQQDYLHDAMQPYHWGLQGMQHISDMGMGAAGAMARQDDLESQLAKEHADASSGFAGSVLTMAMQAAAAAAA